MAALLLPSGSFLVKRHEVLQKTRAEQFGLGRVPRTIESKVGSTEKRSPWRRYAVRNQGVLFASRPLRLPWHVACCQLPGDIVRWSAVTPTLTRRLSLVVGGQGGGWSGTSALLRRSLTGGQLVGHRAVRGYPELMVTEGCVSFSTESTMAEGRALGTTDLKTAEKRVSGVIELKMVERHVSGTTRLMLA
ncbi:hypothetical protein BHE74_00054123 [Ensete ventricosum]|nr:hypothetical protein BHE74_00054123 [Ensete ventricosum]